jgi:hypothetical protein
MTARVRIQVRKHATRPCASREGFRGILTRRLSGHISPSTEERPDSGAPVTRAKQKFSD